MTTTLTLGLLAIALYLGATMHIAWQLRTGHAERRAVFLWLGGIAASAHALIISLTLVQPDGVHLGFFSAGSLVGLLIAVTALALSLVRPVVALSVAAFPTAATALAVALLAQDHQTPRFFPHGLGSHILASLLAYSVLTMAAAHAVLLALQSRLFREHRVQGLLRALPPIQTMESILFELITIGFVLLSLAILAGLLYVDDFFAQHLVHKTVLTIAGWFALAGLLAGHHLAGWRGQTAVRWTLSAFVLLAVAFFGSKFVLELLLHRGM